jgi:hypothetical protein
VGETVQEEIEGEMQETVIEKLVVEEMEGSAENIALEGGVSLHGGLEGIGKDKRLKNTRKRRGEAAESVFLAKAVSMGFGVAKPWGDSERYDFILDSGRPLWRVQVKSAYRACEEGGTRSTRRGMRMGWRIRRRRSMWWWHTWCRKMRGM